jgi:signal transduction histidine kinase
MAGQANRALGAWRIALGAGLLLASGLLFLRAAGPWPGDAVVWPALAAATGALLIWRAPLSVPAKRRGWAAHRSFKPSAPRFSGQRSPGPAQPARVLTLPRPQVSRRGVGVTIVLAAGIAALWANGAIRPAGEAVLTAVVVLAAFALIFAPSWRRLAGSLAAEQAERVRTQERADVGAHLHDSVLQTLALIQRSADDSRRVATLARTQERELRAWLAGEDRANIGQRADGDSLAGALRAAAVEVEDLTEASLEVVAVGDCRLDEPGAAVLAAAREAMLNAAKFAAGEPVSVFAELSQERIAVFVRDRGPGFQPESVPAQRRGVRESIVGRMQRAGGTATIRSTAGAGTEVELAIERARTHGATAERRGEA